MCRKHWGFGVAALLALLWGCVGVGGAPYSVEVSVTPPKVAKPGEVVTHVFTVHNTGSADDLYLLDLKVPSGWDYFPKQDSLPVPAGKEGFVFVNLIVPQEASAGSYEIALRVTSSGDPGVSVEATTAVEVLPRRDLELRWLTPPGRLQVGGRAIWSFSMRNTGNVPDIYRVELETYGDWTADAAIDEVHLLPGEEEVVEIRVEASPRATAGAGYSLRVAVASFHDPTVQKELRAAGYFLPPPPELVPTSLYPQWEVTLGTKLGSEGDPRFSLRGSGDIELFDYHVDAAIGISMEGWDELRLSWEGNGKSFYLHGGGISGLLLGVSGEPLFGGEMEGLGRWRALFAPQVKGISLTAEGKEAVFNFAWGGDAVAGYSFQDLGFRWGLADGVSLWGALSQGSEAAAAGTALQLGGELSRETFRLRAAYFQVSPGYPRQRAREELSLRWEGLSGFLPLDITYRFASFARESSAGRLLSHELRARLSLDLPLQPRLEFGFTRRFHDTSPRDVDERSVTLRVSFRGEEPLPWSVSATATAKDDFAAGTVVGTLGLAGSLSARTDSLELSCSFGVTGTVGPGAEPPSSSFTLRVRVPGAIGSPAATFSAGGERTRFVLSIRGVPAGEAEASGDFSYTLEGGESQWEAGFSLSFRTDFPFLGPTRGRIRGRVFVDRDGDLAFGPEDEGVEGILLEADGVQAISGKGGVFVFPPLLPGVYELSFVDPPAELSPAAPLPAVEVAKGEEVVVEIPLRPRAWLKGIVFNDADKDGKRDPGEGGIRGVELVIRGAGGEWRVETDATGLFSLELPPGRYTVSLVEDSLPERFVPTTPTSLGVEVPEYGVVEVDFGAYRKPRPVVVTFAPPKGVILFSPEQPRVGEPVEFDGTGSEAFGAEIVGYRWEFRLGARRITASGPVVMVAFPEPGEWTVILIVTDSRGRMGAARATVTVSR